VCSYFTTQLLNNILPKIITEDEMGLLQPEVKCKQQNKSEKHLHLQHIKRAHVTPQM
jgi:hypothetical protein